jgi:hypothetical protein
MKRSFILAALGVGFLLSAAAPAFAQRWDRGHGRWHGGPGWHQRWAGPGYWARPGWYGPRPYYYGPRAYYAPPPPVYYPGPVISFYP